MSAPNTNRRPDAIGIAGPLTGVRRAHASLLHRACARLRANGLVPVLLDDQADPATAVKVADRFVSSGVSAVIGHFNSACAEVTRSIYLDAEIPLLVPASSKDSLTDLGGVFRLCPKDSEQARLLWLCVKGLRPADFEVVVDGSPYSERLLDRIRHQACTSGSLRVVHVDDAPASSVCVRLVLATCQGAIRAHRLMGEAKWTGRAVFSDDAHIGAFAGLCTDHVGLRSYVVGANGGFEYSVDLACDLVVKATADEGTGSITSWLRNCGLFSKCGELLGASWSLFKLGAGTRRGEWIATTSPG